MENGNVNVMEEIVSLCKRRGFIFQSSELYGGIGGIYDFGPLGAQLKRNIKDLWWDKFVNQRDDIVGLDTGIVMNAKVWEASGHTGSGFTDPLRECKKCHHRFRADHIKGNVCPDCGGELTEEKSFNILVKTFLGPVEDESTMTYLRGETAQGIFANFKNIVESSRMKIPFGIAQIGKAFRNEITPGNFIFRTREFEQAEIEFFIEADKEESAKWYKYWINEVRKFYTELGIEEDNLPIVEHPREKLSHYSIGTSDIEYKFPFGQSELAGIAQRTDYDLSQHSKYSGIDLKYFDEQTGKKFIPYVIEPSMGIDRALLAFLVEGYKKSDGNDGRKAGEVVIKLHPKIAPVKVAVFPLVNKDRLPQVAQEIYKNLRKEFMVQYDASGSVGRRYRRQDEIGTPWCVTVDFDSLEDKTVTVRDRDSMEQTRAKIDELKEYFVEKLK